MTKLEHRSGRIAAIGHRFADVLIEQGVAEAEAIDVVSYPGRSFDELAEALQEADVVLIGTLLRLGAAELDQIRHLKGIVRYGIGVDNIDVRACQRLGITLCNVPDYGTDEVATHALALLLSMARQVPQADALCRANGWMEVATRLRPLELATATLGVVGAGRIGQRLLALAACLPWRRVVYDPYIAEERVLELGASLAVSLDDLLRQANLITLHMPALEGRPLIGRREIELLPKGAIVVNCARGSLVDDDALADALASGHLGGAGLDVVTDEPMSTDHRLLNMPNVVVTGHSSWVSDGSKRRLRRLAAEEAVRLATDRPPRNPIAAS